MSSRTELTVILAAGKSTRIPELSFDRPKTLLSVGGHTLLLRLIAQFANVSRRFVVVAGKNADLIEAHLAEVASLDLEISVIADPALTEAGNAASLKAGLQHLNDTFTGCHILESDIALSDTAVTHYLAMPETIRTLIVPLRSASDDHLFREHGSAHLSISKRPPEDAEILGKLLGVTHLSVVAALQLAAQIPELSDSAYTDYLPLTASATHALIPLTVGGDEAAEIDTADDYRQVLLTSKLAHAIPAANRLTSLPRRLRLEGPLKRLIGVHDPVGARLAQRSGFDGLWLGSFQIALASGGRDDASYDPRHALDLAERLRAIEIRMPLVVDIGNGINENLQHYVDRAVQAGVSAICIEDNTAERVCSLYEAAGRDLVSVEAFSERIAQLSAAARGRLQIIARTEALTINMSHDEAATRLRAAAEAGADVLLPHYVGKDPQPIESFLRTHPLPRPVLLVPTGLLHLPAREFKSMGCSAVVYANVDLRLRFHRLQEAYARLASEAVLADDIRNALADPITMKNVLEY